jgi:hypothetical protein
MYYLPSHQSCVLLRALPCVLVCRVAGLRAEALEFHRRAGMPEAMVADARSFTFMMTGSSMTDNKNIRVRLLTVSHFIFQETR